MSAPKPTPKSIKEYKVVVMTVFIDQRNFGNTETISLIEIDRLIAEGWTPIGGPSTALQMKREIRPEGMVEKLYMLITQAMIK